MRTIILKVNSELCTNYTNSFKTGFQYSFNSIDAEPHEEIIYSLYECNIPYSFYGVNEKEYEVRM